MDTLAVLTSGFQGGMVKDTAKQAAAPRHAPLQALTARSERFWLAIGFAVLFGLMTLQTFLSLRHIELQQQQLQSVIEEGLAKFDLVGRMHAAGRERIQLLQRIFMTDDPFAREGLREDFSRQAESFLLARQSLLAMPLSVAERALIERQGTLSQRFHRFNLELFDLLDRDETEQAVRLLNEQLLPTQNAVLTTLSELYELQQRNVREIWSYSDRLQQEARRLLLAVAALVFLIGLAVACYVYQRVHEASRGRERLASYDLLTDLPNRLLIHRLLKQIIGRAQRQDQRFALLFVDLDRFKTVNDTLGHRAGDQLLVEVARRLRASVRTADTVGRWAGDEFVVILEDVHTPDEVLAMAEKIRAAVQQPVTIDGQQAQVGASIGIALYPDHGRTQDELLHQADAAMYDVKAAGRDGLRLAASRASEACD